MSSEELRQAAGLMRERAEAATGSPWEQTQLRVMRRSEWMGLVVTREQAEIALCYEARGGSGGNADAEHIASWHPEVALAVADWLDAEAALAEVFRTSFHGTTEETEARYRHALAVARAYLGSAS